MIWLGSSSARFFWFPRIPLALFIRCTSKFWLPFKITRKKFKLNSDLLVKRNLFVFVVTNWTLRPENSISSFGSQTTYPLGFTMYRILQNAIPHLCTILCRWRQNNMPWKWKIRISYVALEIFKPINFNS